MAKKKKRDLVQYPGLNKNLFSKVKQEYHDIDYVDKLDDEAKKFMSQFMEEHLGANLDEKRHKKKYNKKVMHKTKKLKKDCFDRNNARQRDIYGLSKATGKLEDYNTPGVSDYLDSLCEKANVEEQLIDKIDSEKLGQNVQFVQPKKNSSSDS